MTVNNMHTKTTRRYGLKHVVTNLALSIQISLHTLAFQFPHTLPTHAVTVQSSYSLIMVNEGARPLKIWGEP